jgi:hypothetical protein
MDCSRITQGLQAVVCGQPAIPGTGPRVILINYSDIDRSLSTVNGNVISSIILKEDATGYDFASLDNANLGEVSYNKGTYFGNWQHDLTMRVFAKNEVSKKFVNSLNGARVVAVVENKESGSDGGVKYEAYGWDAGLELNEGTASTDMADMVVYQIKAGSGANSKEGSLPKSVFATDLDHTETMLNALVTS